jgi:hypothetical protein
LLRDPREGYLTALLGLYDRYRRQVEHEDNLVNHRVSWLVASQSFLLGTYVFLLTPATGALNVVDEATLRRTVTLLQQCFSVAGLIASLAVAMSVSAALFALSDLVRDYRRKVVELDEAAKHLNRDDRDAAKQLIPPIISRWPRRLLGCAAATGLPTLFASVWSILWIGSEREWSVTLIVTGFALVFLAETWFFAEKARRADEPIEES